MIRIKLEDSSEGPGTEEFEKRSRALFNNHPALVKEWLSGRVLSKNLQEHFGALGGNLKRAGWEGVTLGPVTEGVISRFMVKLAQALYYRHNGALLDGVVYAQRLSSLMEDFTPAHLHDLLAVAPTVANPVRSSVSLIDQFIYRFNHSSDDGVLYAAVRFSEQLIFRLVALTWDAESAVLERKKGKGDGFPGLTRYECRLEHRPT